LCAQRCSGERRPRLQLGTPIGVVSVVASAKTLAALPDDAHTHFERVAPTSRRFVLFPTGRTPDHAAAQGCAGRASSSRPRVTARAAGARYPRAMGAVQLGLFGSEQPGFDHRYATLRRVMLSDDAWIDYQPGFITGHAALFDQLASTTAWRIGEEQIYEKTLPTPRLLASLPEDGPGHPLLEDVRRSLSERYGEAFVRVSMALYRDGRDSVAFHGDRIARTLPSALVATVSLGAPRRFLMRPRDQSGRRASQAWNVGWGDLFVMGGSCQRTWQHGIPKVAHAQPRIAVMFRPRWEYADKARDQPRSSRQ
jgi:alkylated DNA repair dioxygenase AlkB